MTYFTIYIFVYIFSLKASLISDVKDVRAASVRALRYMINDANAAKTFTNLQMDYLVTR